MRRATGLDLLLQTPSLCVCSPVQVFSNIGCWSYRWWIFKAKNILEQYSSSNWNSPWRWICIIHSFTGIAAQFINFLSFVARPALPTRLVGLWRDGWIGGDLRSLPPTQTTHPLLTDNSSGWLIVLISDVQKMIYLLQWSKQQLDPTHPSHVKSWWCRLPSSLP